MLDSSATAQAVDYTNGQVYALTTGINRGTADNQYLGDRITPVGMNIRIQYTRADSTQLFRFIVIQNKAGGIPLLNTLLASTGNITAPLSPYDNNYNNTYRVLYDRLVSTDSIRQTTGLLNIRIGAKKLRQIWFNDGVGTLEKGGIYFMVISDSAVTPHPAIDYRARFYFKDA